MHPLSLLLLLAWHGVLGERHSGVLDPDGADPEVIRQIGELAIEFTQRLYDEMLLDDEEVQGLNLNVDDLDNASDEEVFCLDCVAMVGGIKALIDRGLTLEDIKPIAMPICHNICEGNNWRGDIICDGMIDSFGPHVMYVLNNTELTAREVCLKHRICDAFSVEHESKLDYFAPRPHKSKVAKNPPRRNLEDALKVVHFTDIHIDEQYFTGAATDCMLPVCCRDYWNGTGSAGAYGDYNCNVPPRTVELFADLLSAMDPDIVIYTGDSPPHSLWEETLDIQVGASRYVANMITDHFPGVDAYTCIGNHETYPTNQYYPPINETELFAEAYYEMWRDLGDLDEENHASIMEAGNYQKLIRPGLRMLSYNSNYGYTDNFYGVLNEIHEGWLATQEFMQSTFDLARANGEKILLLGHHPIGGRGYFEYYEEFIDDIIAKNGDLVVLHALGHTHGNSFKLSIDEESGEPTNVWMVTAAVSCSPNNPTARMFYLDPDTFRLLDYDTFHLDIQAAMETGKEAQIERIYRATEEYGIDDVMPEAMFDLTERFLTDDELFDRYRFNGNARRAQPGPCTGVCRTNAVCGMRTTAHWKYVECINQATEQMVK